MSLGWAQDRRSRNTPVLCAGGPIENAARARLGRPKRRWRTAFTKQPRSSRCVVERRCFEITVRICSVSRFYIPVCSDKSEVIFRANRLASASLACAARALETPTHKRRKGNGDLCILQNTRSKNGSCVVSALTAAIAAGNSPALAEVPTSGR